MQGPEGPSAHRPDSKAGFWEEGGECILPDAGNLTPSCSHRTGSLALPFLSHLKWKAGKGLLWEWRTSNGNLDPRIAMFKQGMMFPDDAGAASG